VTVTICRCSLFFLGLLLLAGGAFAQGEHQHHEPAAAADEHAGHAAQVMRAWYGRYAATRESSGTSWQPEASPHEGLHARLGEWDTMTHGFANLIYDDQGGPRGDTKTFMTSMLMVMGNRPVGEAGTLGLRAMVSADPAFGKGGYPLLFQTGETADGQTPGCRGSPRSARRSSCIASRARTIPRRRSRTIGSTPRTSATGS
jgi:hypothetical protein